MFKEDPDTIGDDSSQTYVSRCEENVFAAERLSDPAPGKDLQETTDESSLTEDCIKDRVNSSNHPSNEQELNNEFSDKSNPSPGFEEFWIA